MVRLMILRMFLKASLEKLPSKVPFHSDKQLWEFLAHLSHKPLALCKMQLQASSLQDFATYEEFGELRKMKPNRALLTHLNKSCMDLHTQTGSGNTAFCLRHFFVS